MLYPRDVSPVAGLLNPAWALPCKASFSLRNVRTFCHIFSKHLRRVQYRSFLLHLRIAARDVVWTKGYSFSRHLDGRMSAQTPWDSLTLPNASVAAKLSWGSAALVEHQASADWSFEQWDTRKA